MFPMREVTSSNIHSIGYDPTQLVLCVRFKDNAGTPGKTIYTYRDVPLEIGNGFATTESVGKWYASKVRGKFDHELMDVRDDAPAARQAPQGFSPDPRPQIPLTPVTSSQVKAIGYDAESETLAVTFTRGTGAIYHYPGVSADVAAAFVAAESIGTFFGQHIKPLAFEKFPAEPAAEALPA